MLRMQLEASPQDLDLVRVVEPGECFLESPLTDVAPRAHHIRPDFYPHCSAFPCRASVAGAGTCTGDVEYQEDWSGRRDFLPRPIFVFRRLCEHRRWLVVHVSLLITCRDARAAECAARQAGVPCALRCLPGQLPARLVLRSLLLLPGWLRGTRSGVEHRQ